MVQIQSFSDFAASASGMQRAYLLLYKSGSDSSRCALENLKQAAGNLRLDNVFTADVNQAKDIHTRYGIGSVPSLLLFANGGFENTIKGCQDPSYYEAVLQNIVYQAAIPEGQKPVRQVTVYSTPTCSWCNTLKLWLQKNNIRYTDVDISRDQKAADALVRRSGQQGVPQTDINGQIVVGFNQPLLKELLEIS